MYHHVAMTSQHIIMTLMITRRLWRIKILKRIQWFLVFKPWLCPHRKLSFHVHMTSFIKYNTARSRVIRDAGRVHDVWSPILSPFFLSFRFSTAVYQPASTAEALDRIGGGWLIASCTWLIAWPVSSTDTTSSTQEAYDRKKMRTLPARGRPTCSCHNAFSVSSFTEWTRYHRVDDQIVLASSAATWRWRQC